MANSVRLALCSLGVRARFDWVPTDANISDTPSRVSRKADMSEAEEAAWNLLELPSEDGWTPMIFPSVSALHTYDACAQLVPHKRTHTYTRVQGSSEKSPSGAAHTQTPNHLLPFPFSSRIISSRFVPYRIALYRFVSFRMSRSSRSIARFVRSSRSNGSQRAGWGLIGGVSIATLRSRV